MRIFSLFFLTLTTFYIVTPIYSYAQSSENSFSIGLPLDCSIGHDCYIQNYVDSAPGDSHADYHCGILAYNGHKGTDFTVKSQHLHKDPVNVIAVADGAVLGVRNHIPDLHPKFASELYKKIHLYGTECGNGLVIKHADGFETQYCHLRQGSLQVQSGDKVKKGDILGTVGLSGKTEFPHIHFSLRHNSTLIDPFTGNAMETGCTPSPSVDNSYWDDDLYNVLTYVDSAIVDYGIKNNLPLDAVSARSGLYHSEAFSDKTQQAILWVDIVRPTKGDIIEISLPYPDGAEKTFTHIIDKTQVRRFQYLGTKTPPKGAFPQNSSPTIVYKLTRNGTIIDEKQLALPWK